MTIDEMNILYKKAEIKKDGIYSFRGNLWVVKNFKFIAYSDFFGECYQVFGSFTSSMGKVNSYERKQKLKDLMKKIE